MIEILTWVSIITGGLLILMLIVSIIGGLDLDFDMDIGPEDIETDAGGMGVIKGFLTFISVSAWVVKVLLVSNKHPGIALAIGIFAGVVAFLLLNYLLKLLLKSESNVNWSIKEALYQKGEVYLKIPGDEGSGIVQIKINGALRELKAKSQNHEEIKTGSRVIVMEVEGEYVVVQQEDF